MTRDEAEGSRVVVTRTERMADDLARAGERAVSFRRLKETLAVHLAGDAAFASDLLCRLALAATLGPRVVPLVHDALGALHAARVPLSSLERLAGRRQRLALFDVPATVAARARLLLDAGQALARVLAGLGLTDPRELDLLLAERIPRADAGDLAARVGLVLELRGVLDRTPAELAWFGALDARLRRLGGSATVTVPQPGGRMDAARERTPLEIVADDVARALDDAPLATPLDCPLGGGTFSGPLEDRTAERVGVTRALSRGGQARAAVALASRALAGGAPIDRVAIVTPSGSEASLAPLRAALERSGIPFVAPAPPLVDVPVVAYFLRFLRLGVSLDRETLSMLLSSRYLRARSLAPDAEARAAAIAMSRIAHFLETVRVPRVDGARDQMDALATTYGTDRPHLDTRAEAEVFRRLGSILAPFGATAPRRDLILAVRRAAANLGISERVAVGATSFFASDVAPRSCAAAELRAVAADAHAWETFSDHLDAYERATELAGIGARTIAPADLLDELARTAPVPGARSGQRAGALRVMGLAEAAGESLELAIVVDAALGALPSEGQPDGLLSEAFMNELDARAAGGVLWSARSTRARELGQLLLLASASARLEFVHSTTDADGAARAPSGVVTWLATGGVPVATGPASPLAADRAAVARAMRERTRETFFLDPARRASSEVGSLSDPRVLGAVVEETGVGERALAATSIERFATCPFQGFAHEVLRARDAFAVADRMDAREEGSVLHAALAQAFTAVRDLMRARPRDVAAILERGTLAAREALGPAGQGLFGVDPGRMLAAVRLQLDLACADEEWDFARAEQGFGGPAEGEWPPFSLADGETRLLVRGRIDRLDVGRHRSAVRAIDYKRSRGKTDTAGLGETKLQVPLYARVAQHHMGLDACEGAYVPISPRYQAEPTRVTDRFRDRLATLVRAPEGELAPIERTVLDVVSSARCGTLTPTPHDEAACRTCGVDGGCRRPRYTMRPED